MTALIDPCPDCGGPRTYFGPHIIHAGDSLTAGDAGGELRSRTVCPAMAEVQRILAEANTPTRTPASFGRLGVEMALPAPAEEVERNIRLGIDLAGDRVVTVACEIRNGVVYLLTSHELDR